MESLLRYLYSNYSGYPISYEDPVEGLWEGVYHPDAPATFARIEDYLECTGKSTIPPWVIFFYRIYWANNDLRVIDALIREFERPIPTSSRSFPQGAVMMRPGQSPGPRLSERSFQAGLMPWLRSSHRLSRRSFRTR